MSNWTAIRTFDSDTGENGTPTSGTCVDLEGSRNLRVGAVEFEIEDYVASGAVTLRLFALVGGRVTYLGPLEIADGERPAAKLVQVNDGSNESLKFYALVASGTITSGDLIARAIPE